MTKRAGIVRGQVHFVCVGVARGRFSLVVLFPTRGSFYGEPSGLRRGVRGAPGLVRVGRVRVWRLGTWGERLSLARPVRRFKQPPEVRDGRLATGTAGTSRAFTQAVYMAELCVGRCDRCRPRSSNLEWQNNTSGSVNISGRCAGGKRCVPPIDFRSGRTGTSVASTAKYSVAQSRPTRDLARAPRRGHVRSTEYKSTAQGPTISLPLLS